MIVDVGDFRARSPLGSFNGTLRIKVQVFDIILFFGISGVAEKARKY